MTFHWGKVHNYIRMTLDYNEGGTIKVRNIDYIGEIIASFYKSDPRGSGINTSAAPEDLYRVDEGCEKLSTDKAKMFHNLVAKTLYTTKWESPDTYKEVSLLAKIVS